MPRSQAQPTAAPSMRAVILDAATRRFAAYGFDGASLQDIASEVRIRKPSLLYHFSSKEQLRDEVIDNLLDHWLDAIPRLMHTRGGKRQARAILSEALSYFTAEPDRARLLLREMLDRPKEMRAKLARHMRPWVGLLADAIRAGQREGRIHADLDPEEYIFHVVQLVLGAVALDGLGSAFYPKARAGAGERRRAELVRLCLAGLFVNTEHS